MLRRQNAEREESLPQLQRLCWLPRSEFLFSFATPKNKLLSFRPQFRSRNLRNRQPKHDTSSFSITTTSPDRLSLASLPKRETGSRFTIGRVCNRDSLPRSAVTTHKRANRFRRLKRQARKVLPKTMSILRTFLSQRRRRCCRRARFSPVNFLLKAPTRLSCSRLFHLR